MDIEKGCAGYRSVRRRKAAGLGAILDGGPETSSYGLSDVAAAGAMISRGKRDRET